MAAIRSKISGRLIISNNRYSRRAPHIAKIEGAVAKKEQIKDVNTTLRSLYIVVDLNVAVNNVKLLRVVMEM